MNVEKRATALLIKIAEGKNARISGVLLLKDDPSCGRFLRDAALLVREGSEPCMNLFTNCNVDLLKLTWIPEFAGYGYFHPKVGLTPVDPEHLCYFYLNVEMLISRLVSRLDLSTNIEIRERVSDLLWEIGNARLPGFRKRVSLWFVRRLCDCKVRKKVGDYLRRHLPGMHCVVLTTSSLDSLPVDKSDRWRIDRHRLIPIYDLGTCDSPLVINPNYLSASLKEGLAYQQAEIVRYSPDFRHVWVGKKEFFFRGDKRRQIVAYLLRAWERGDSHIGTEVMFADLDFGTTSRMRDIFKGHTTWRELIETKKGFCRLRIVELLDEEALAED